MRLSFGFFMPVFCIRIRFISYIDKRNRGVKIWLLFVIGVLSVK